MRRMFVAVLLTATQLCFLGCNNKQSDTPSAQQAQPAATAIPTEFNTTDKSIASNDNVIVAAGKLKDDSPDSLWAKSEKISVNKLTKSPYSSLGKPCKITGRIYKLEEMPPSPGMQGSWSEILMLVGNANSPLGATTVSFIYKGDISEVNSNQTITCAGYFIGTYESQNSMGGMVEGVVLVGNKLVRL